MASADIETNHAKVTEYISQVEEIAEEILTDRQQVVALDQRRNKNREAIRALKKESEKKTWLSCGNIFIKFPTNKAKEMLENDQQELDREIDKIRTELKSKVSKLRKAEGKPEIVGFNLRPLDRNEVASLNKLIPNVRL